MNPPSFIFYFNIQITITAIYNLLLVLSTVPRFSSQANVRFGWIYFLAWSAVKWAYSVHFY